MAARWRSTSQPWSIPAGSGANNVEIAMRKKIICAICTLALLLAFALTAAADMQSANYSIPASVLSSGGTTMDSASYQMTTTIGQSSCIGLSSRRSYINYAGFWQPSKLEIKRRAMPWIPLLLLDD